MSDRFGEIRKLASDLLKQDSKSDERVQIRVDRSSILPLYLARSFPSGSFAAIIGPVSTSDLPRNYRRPKIKGLDIHWHDVDAKAGGKFDIVLELTKHDATDIFLLFVARLCEVAEDCETGMEAIHQVLGQIEQWKDFFSGAAGEALSENAQTGLFGELTLLRDLINSGIDASVAYVAWTGASATNQDFEFGDIAIEVKSTTSADSNVISVSNVRQLDPTGVDSLYLSRFAFDVRQGKVETLVTLIEELRECVAKKAAHLLLHFEQNLLNAGFRDCHSDVYGNRAYTLRHHQLFEVDGDFPRIEEKDLSRGISKVKYRINLHGCDQYRKDFDIVMRRVEAASG